MEVIILGGLCIIIYIFYRLEVRELKNSIEDIHKDYKEIIVKERADAINKSKSVIRGAVSEEMIPLLKDFPYTLSDCKFSGQPIDYIVFNGMSTIRDIGKGDIEIIIADVKTGNATTSKVQNAIKKAVINKNIRFETWIVKDGLIKIK